MCLQFILINFFNTEYSIRAILTSSVLSLFLMAYFAKFKSSLQLPKNITLIYSIYLLLSLISFLLSKTPNTGLAEITQDLSSITLFISVYTLLNNTTYGAKLISNIFKANIVTQSLLVIYQTIFQNHPRGFGSFMSFFDHRLVYPNALALSLLLSIFAIQDSKSKHKHIFTIIGTLTLLLTYSRGAIIAGLLGIILFTIMKATKKDIKLILKPIISIIIATSIFGLMNTTVLDQQQELQEKFTFQGTEQITSVMERKQFFTLSPRLINDHLFGYGPNSFSYIFPTIQEIPLSNSQHPHNIFLKISIERGILALITFITLCTFTFHHVFINKIYLHNTGTIVALSSAGLHSLIDYNFNLPLNTFLLILTLASIWQTTNTNKKNNKLIANSIFISTALITSLLFTTHLTYISPNKSPLELSNINYKDSLILASLQEQSLQQKIELVTEHTEKNTFDSFAFSNLAHLYTLQNNNQLAILNFQKSIQLNPKNFWYPYAELTSIHQEISTDESNFILDRLLEYEKAAQQNLHFTAQSDNINQAIKTAKNLKTLASNPNQISEIQNIILSLQSSQERFSSN